LPLPLPLLLLLVVLVRRRWCQQQKMLGTPGGA